MNARQNTCRTTPLTAVAGLAILLCTSLSGVAAAAVPHEPAGHAEHASARAVLVNGIHTPAGLASKLQRLA